MHCYPYYMASYFTYRAYIIYFMIHVTGPVRVAHVLRHGRGLRLLDAMAAVAGAPVDPAGRRRGLP